MSLPAPDYRASASISGDGNVLQLGPVDDSLQSSANVVGSVALPVVNYPTAGENADAGAIIAGSSLLLQPLLNASGSLYFAYPIPGFVDIIDVQCTGCFA